MNPITDTFWKRSLNRDQAEDWEKQRRDNRDSTQLHADYHHMEQQIDKLMLITRALWEMLAETRDFKESDFLSKVKEIDLRDGELDGKLSKPPRDCPACGHRLHARNYRCIYCGAAVENDDLFAG
jgi:hypothetical protein